MRRWIEMLESCVNSAPARQEDLAARVALAKSLPSYRAQASKAAASLDVPASQRAIVRAYFDGLGKAADPSGKPPAKAGT